MSRRSHITRVLIATLLVAPAVQAYDGCRVSDVGGDGTVGLQDFDAVFDALGTVDARKDLDGNGTVGDEDIAILMSFFGAKCAASCPADLDGDGYVDANDRKAVELDFGLDCRPDLDRDGFVDVDGLDSDDDSDLLVAYVAKRVAPHSAASRADFDADGDVDSDDLDFLLAAVSRNCRADLNKDGQVNVTDIWALLASWGTCP